MVVEYYEYLKTACSLNGRTTSALAGDEPKTAITASTAKALVTLMPVLHQR